MNCIVCLLNPKYDEEQIKLGNNLEIHYSAEYYRHCRRIKNWNHWKSYAKEWFGIWDRIFKEVLLDNLLTPPFRGDG